MTSRTVSSGDSRAASVIFSRMFSLPVTRRISRRNACSTRFCARALIRCTVEISSSTSVSVISRCREYASAASNVTLTGFGCAFRWLGDSANARSRHPLTIFGEIPANMPGGKPRPRARSSLRISASIEFRLTSPGADLIWPSTPAAPSPAASRASSSSVPEPTRARMLSTTAGSGRMKTRENSTCSPRCSADPTMASMRWVAGGSICSRRHRVSSSSRTWSARRSPVQTCSASQSVSFSASATLHGRQPRVSRSSRRCALICRPSQS